MDLPSFIRKVGIDEAAELFDAQPGAVKAWLYRERRPRPEKGFLIDERTKGHPAGRVRFAEIYTDTRQ